MAVPVPTPRKGSEVSRAWLERVVTTHEGRTSPGATVQVTDFEVNAGSKPGDNVASEVMKMKVVSRVTLPDGSPPFVRRYDLVAKFFQGTEFDKIFTKTSRLDLKELLIFSDVIKDLNAYQEKLTGGKYTIVVPGYVYGICTDDEWALVMEDVSTKGYKTLDKARGLDLPHLLMAVDRLARVHAVSHAFNQTHDFLQKYPAFTPDDSMVETFLAILAVTYDGALRLAKQRGADFNPIVVKMTNNKDVIFANMRQLFSVPSMQKNKILCLVHGDYWTNNLMFRPREAQEGESSAPEDLMLIDWGLVMWNNPIFDIQYLLYSSTTLDMRKAHLREIMSRYHATFTAATRDLGVQVSEWEVEDMLKEWRRTAVYGLLIGIFANVVTLAEATKVSFQKGSLSSGWSSMIKTALAKVIIPVMMSPRMAPVITFIMRKSMDLMLTELLSEENHTLTTRVFDILMEAFENGALDPDHPPCPGQSPSS